MLLHGTYDIIDVPFILKFLPYNPPSAPSLTVRNMHVSPSWTRQMYIVGAFSII